MKRRTALQLATVTAASLALPEIAEAKEPQIVITTIRFPHPHQGWDTEETYSQITKAILRAPGREMEWVSKPATVIPTTIGGKKWLGCEHLTATAVSFEVLAAWVPSMLESWLRYTWSIENPCPPGMGHKRSDYEIWRDGKLKYLTDLEIHHRAMI